MDAIFLLDYVFKSSNFRFFEFFFAKYSTVFLRLQFDLIAECVYVRKVGWIVFSF